MKNNNATPNVVSTARKINSVLSNDALVGEMTVEKSIIFKNGEKRETNPLVSKERINTPSLQSRPTTKQFYRDTDNNSSKDKLIFLKETPTIIDRDQCLYTPSKLTMKEDIA